MKYQLALAFRPLHWMTLLDLLWICSYAFRLRASIASGLERVLIDKGARMFEERISYLTSVTLLRSTI